MAFIEDVGRTAGTTTTTGSGAVSVAGGAVFGYQEFNAGKLAVNDTFPGGVVASDGQWMEGIWTYSAANQVTFTTILDGSSGTSPISLPSGTHTVFAGFLGLGKTISNAPTKSAPVDGDILGLWDSVASLFKGLTIANLKALWRGANTFTAAQEWATGSNIASASTVNLDTATGNRVHVTGTTTITAVTLTRGPRTVVFDGILTLTHHATNNKLPGAANITTGAGDVAIYESDGTTVFVSAYTKADGTPLSASPVTTYTPTVSASTGTFTTVSATGRYQKIGKQVFWSAQVTITTNGTAAGNVQLTLPITAVSNTVGTGRATGVSGKQLQVTIAGSNATIFNYDNTYPGASGEVLQVSLNYEVA